MKQSDKHLPKSKSKLLFSDLQLSYSTHAGKTQLIRYRDTCEDTKQREKEASNKSCISQLEMLLQLPSCHWGCYCWFRFFHLQIKPSRIQQLQASLWGKQRITEGEVQVDESGRENKKVKHSFIRKWLMKYTYITMFDDFYRWINTFSSFYYTSIL